MDEKKIKVICLYADNKTARYLIKNIEIGYGLVLAISLERIIKTQKDVTNDTKVYVNYSIEKGEESETLDIEITMDSCITPYDIFKNATSKLANFVQEFSEI